MGEKSPGDKTVGQPKLRQSLASERDTGTEMVPNYK